MLSPESSLPPFHLGTWRVGRSPSSSNLLGPFLGSALTGQLSFSWCVTIFAGMNGVAILLYFMMSMHNLWQYKRYNILDGVSRKDSIIDISTDATLLSSDIFQSF